MIGSVQDYGNSRAVQQQWSKHSFVLIHSCMVYFYMMVWGSSDAKPLSKRMLGLILILLKGLLQNFAYDMTAMLWCHMQKKYCDWMDRNWITAKCEISIEFEFWVKIISEMGSDS